MLSGPLSLTTNGGNLFRNVCSLVPERAEDMAEGEPLRHAGSAQLPDEQDLTNA